MSANSYSDNVSHLQNKEKIRQKINAFQIKADTFHSFILQYLTTLGKQNILK
jgi:hypothetical protein